MATNVQQYTDFDISFVPHPITGDIGVISNEASIKNSLKGLILTVVGDRPFHPEVSCMMESLLFEDTSPFTCINIQRTIEDVIQNFEPRVKLLSVTVTQYPQYRNISVTITFQIVTSPKVYTITQILELVR